MAKKKKEKKMDARDPASKRLDAIIRLNIEMNKLLNDKFTDAIAANALKSVGLTPTEIARIFGKESRTDITYLLYGKDSDKKKK
jgi:hypothetical protein